MDINTGISVIIPNYNGRDLLPQTLPYLYAALGHSGLPYEIIISDDASSDESAHYIRNTFPEIKLLVSDTNQGFSCAINKGIFAARYELLLLLNSDVKLTFNYFEKLPAYFSAADTFGVMGRITGWDDDEIQDGGKYPAFQGVKIKTSGNYIPVNPDEDKRLYTMYLSGANAMVSREKMYELGGFDELFSPFYVEDFELSLRAWRLGWKCYYEHHAVCRHRTSATIKSESSKNFVKAVYYRNKMFLHAIHLTGYKSVIWYLQLLPEAIMQLFTGRKWFFSALKMFFSSQKGIANSKEKFKKLAEKKSVNLSVHAVVNKILLCINKIRITKFK